MNDNAEWNVAVIGECMLELRQEERGTTISFGGDTLNTAAYLARVGTPDVRVEYVSAVGADTDYSQPMTAFWHECGVGSRLTQRLPGKLPGLYAIAVDSKGERKFHYWRSAAAVRGCFETPGASAVLEALGQFDRIYLSGITLAVLYPASREVLVRRLEELASQGVAVDFDFNFRPHLWGDTPLENARPWYKRLASICHTVFLSADESALLGEPGTSDITVPSLDDLRRLGAEEVVVKNGGEPCQIALRGQEYLITVPVHAVNPVDTTAAGDSFAAAYIAARHKGFAPAESVLLAHRLAAEVIMHHGAIIPAQFVPRLFG